MAMYEFEATMLISDILDIEADSYEEACALAMEEAESYYAVSVAGYSMPWDSVKVDCTVYPDEEG